MIILTLLAASGVASGQISASAAEPDPKSMSQAEIRAYNASLKDDDPFFIRCKRSKATGSLISRSYSCRTNAQWAASDVTGNQDARDTMDRMTSKSWNTN